MVSFIVFLVICSSLLGLCIFFAIRFKKSQDETKQLRNKLSASEENLEERMRDTLEEKKRLFGILESMTEGVLVVDTEQKILLVNSALCGLFDVRKNMVEGKHYWEIFRDPDVNQMVQECLDKQKGSKKELDFLLTKSIFDIHVSPVFASKEFIGIVAVFRDITPLKEFDKMRTEFVANVSHELKTPLTSILGFVETLKEGAIDDKENSHKFLSIIETQSKKLNTLIEDLLLLSRIESSNEPVRKEPVRVKDLMDKLTETFGPLLIEKRISFKTGIEPKDLKIKVELSSFERAISNLIDNAVKYSPAGSQVSVEVTGISPKVTITVKDNGIGIPESDLPRIFERFYRVDKGRTRESGGTGLGLSIVKHIIERHSGSVHVESTPQKGSTFTITLPQ